MEGRRKQLQYWLSEVIRRCRSSTELEPTVAEFLQDQSVAGSGGPGRPGGDVRAVQFTETSTQTEPAQPMAAAFLPHLNFGGTQVGDRRVAHSLYVYTPPELSLHHLMLNVQAELTDAGARTL